MKPYKIGMYGGKFMPLHKGHFACLEQASKECEKVYFICFINGKQEKEIISNNFDDMFSLNSRLKAMYRAQAKLATNCEIIVQVIDVAGCFYEDGTENWDAETPLVRAICGDKIDAVYGSEISYGEYFAKAYPEAEYRIVDADRTKTPISATAIRNMTDNEEIKKWII